MDKKKKISGLFFFFFFPLYLHLDINFYLISISLSLVQDDFVIFHQAYFNNFLLGFSHLLPILHSKPVGKVGVGEKRPQVIFLK